MSTTRINTDLLSASGSTGTVQFNSSGAFNADTDFFWDNSTKRLGIGTASPGYDLDVAGVVHASGRFLTNEAGNAVDMRNEVGANARTNIFMRGTDGSSVAKDWYIGLNHNILGGVYEIYGPSGSNFLINTSGNVGIGTGATVPSMLSVGSGSPFQVDSTGSVLTSSTGYLALGGSSLGSGSQRLKLPDSEFIVWSTTSAKIGAGSTNMVINAASGASNAVLVNYGGAGAAGGGGLAVYEGSVSPVVKFRVDPAGTTSYIVGAFGVNASSLNAASQLQVDSTTKGFLPPRMTTAQRDAISSPPAGLVIYNTTTGALEVFS